MPASPTLHHPELARRVREQAVRQPRLYGDLDLTARPYRLAIGPDDESSLPGWAGDRDELLADEELVELMSTATMLGDVVADPYASLMAERSFKELVDLLHRACRDGIDAVPDAPPELRALIAAMEATPEWLDMDLVEEGARHARIPSALVAPWVTRGAFLATFVNTYAALPMALTGALGGRKAARRVNETASFFAVTTLPGALDRHGPGFEAAAMVRLMHSMVRYNALKRSDRWDFDVYGVPIPQVDQMPAGMIGQYLSATRALREGRTTFTPRERALIEFGRYRCYLLGLPEELLPTEPGPIVRVMHGRAAMLRDGFDDDTCGALVRATMDAWLRPDRTPVDRALELVERSFGKSFFVRAFAGGNRDAARRMGVPINPLERAVATATAPLVFGSVAAFVAADRIPVVRDVADASLVQLLKWQLASYGHPEFVTDHATYTPTTSPRPAVA
ncbi:MAG: oxygenase MpaB family protein [Solirubrobacteraceae bacterium]|nr:oxygenase MpaB family protein [Solirubrobacteraceae bacterium]